MKGWRTFFAIAPFAITFFVFAVVNRHSVEVSFNPPPTDDFPAFAVHGPLLVIIIGSIIVGVRLGGAATWFTQGRLRRAAREARDADLRLRADVNAIKSAGVLARLVKL